MHLASGSADAVTAFYAFVHVPQAEQQRVLNRIADWLRPGGVLLAQFGSGDAPDEVEDGWLVEDPGEVVRFHHVAARRPA